MPKNMISAILVTALVAGTLDGLAAITSYLLQGGSRPASIFKFIASGVVGRPALAGGNETVALGVLLHFFIATLFTVFYFLIFPAFRMPARHPLLSGVAYGIFVWLVMNLVVLPLSEAPALVHSWKKVTLGVSILILCIGIPVAYLSRKYYLYKN
jgi:hypothetical protein